MFVFLQCLKESEEGASQKTHSRSLITLDRFVRSAFVTPATHTKQVITTESGLAHPAGALREPKIKRVKELLTKTPNGENERSAALENTHPHLYQEQRVEL